MLSTNRRPLSAPQPCLLCLTPAEQALCPDCIQELPYNQTSCQRCALPLPSAGLCPQCQRRPPPFSTTLAPLLYQAPVNHLITSIKSDRHSACYPALARILWQAAATQYSSDSLPDRLLPVPLHWWRLMHRGFNQSALLAEMIAQFSQLPIASKLAVRRQYLRPQHLQNRRARWRSMRNAFQITAAVKNQHLAVIDDVMTTSATTRALAQSLLDAGATRVDIWCIARTPLD